MRKVKLLKAPKFDLGALLTLHGESVTDESGQKASVNILQSKDQHSQLILLAQILRLAVGFTCQIFLLSMIIICISYLQKF